MRIRTIALASLLGVTIGCPGDDGETDTGSMTTGMSTTTTMNNDSSGGGGESTSTGGGGESTSTGGGGESTSTGGSTSSVGGSSSSDGGNSACEMFCADFAAACGDGPFNDYGDEASCVQLCGQFDQAELDCRVEHVGYAMDDGTSDSVHCEHASRSGGGVC